MCWYLAGNRCVARDIGISLATTRDDEFLSNREMCLMREPFSSGRDCMFGIQVTCSVTVHILLFDIVVSGRHSEWRQITSVRRLGRRTPEFQQSHSCCGYWYPQGFRDICKICIAFVAREHYPNKLEHTSATGILFGFVRHLKTGASQVAGERMSRIEWG